MLAGRAATPSCLDRLAAEGHAVVVTAAPDETAFVADILERATSKPINLAGQLRSRSSAR